MCDGRCGPTLLLLLAVPLLVSGCDGGAFTEPESDRLPASIEILPDSLAPLYNVGDTLVLDAVVRDQAGEVIEGAAVRWYTAHPEIVKVLFSDGIVVAKAGGQARIFAEIKDIRESVSVWAWPDITATYTGPMHYVSGEASCEGDARVRIGSVEGGDIQGTWEVGGNQNDDSGCGGRFPTTGTFSGMMDPNTNPGALVKLLLRFEGGGLVDPDVQFTSRATRDHLDVSGRYQVGLTTIGLGFSGARR